MKLQLITESIEYPVVAVHHMTGIIVVFKNSKCGVYIGNNTNEDDKYENGYYSEDWTSVENKNHWRILQSHEHILLEQP